jgi:molybdopterin-containing oxidoreductase family membrane subunit
MAISYSEMNDIVLEPLRVPRRLYFVVVSGLAALVCWAAFCWLYQIERGLGVAGINHPAGWGVYITSFVFWVGIAHSGTLISAILYLVRSRWRTAVSRSAEAMTVFAVMTAGLFPLIHLGRVWVVFFLLPYPSERQLWPNFVSPLVWDVVAVSTYFTVSAIFWYVGLWPDLASARDRSVRLLGADHPRTKFYRYLALGWSGSGNEWRHHGRGFLFFAALATPLVVSVHSVVSWDFAMGLLPGWHTTIFAPYFVAGAIHSGLAMVLTLMVPMRRLLKLERVLSIDQFESVAQTMIVTTLIVGYAYLIEPFIAWYSGDIFEQQFAWWRATGSWTWGLIYWSLFLFNVLIPLSFLFRKVRRNLVVLFIVSILVNVGMWLERLLIITGSLSHDFLPHNWGHYFPTWVEFSILTGSFAWFLFWFFAFSRLFPTIALSDLKADAERDEPPRPKIKRARTCIQSVRKATSGVAAVFRSADALMEAVRNAREAGYERIETYSPHRLIGAEQLLGRGSSPVRYWCLIGAVSGLTAGFGLAIYAAVLNNLIVGAKPPVALIPYCVIGFEGTVLLGTIANLLGLLFHARLGPPKPPRWYDERFSVDRFGLFVGCTPERVASAKEVIASTAPEEVHVVE